MSDDLVQRLRQIYDDEGVPQKAADRIEELDAIRQHHLDISANAILRIAMLEAALRGIFEHLDGPWYEYGAALNRARRALEGKS